MFTGTIGHIRDAIDELTAETVAGVPQGGAIIELEHLRGRLEAEIARRVVVLRHSCDWTERAQSTAGWIRHQTRTSGSDANRRVRLAQTVDDLASTSVAWAAGEITTKHVEMIVKIRRLADADEYFFAYESFLVDLAKTDSPEVVFGTGRAWLEALHDHLDRDGSDRKPQPVANQAVYYSRTLDGSGVLNGTFDTEAAAVVEAAFDLAYTRGHRVNDPRRAPEQRANAFVEICQAYIESRPSTGNRPNLLLINELAAFQGHVIGRCETINGHPIPQETVRRIACNAKINIVDTHNGIPLAMGRTQRIFTPHQYRAMIIRDGQCRGPGCEAPPSRCEAHHFDEWSAGHGTTDLNRGFLMCKGRCHRQVHEGGWTITGDVNGTLTFVDRDGNIIGTSTPREPNQKYLTQLGQDHQAIQQRITELITQHNAPPPETPTHLAA